MADNGSARRRLPPSTEPGRESAAAPRHAGRIANLRDEAIAALTTWRTNVESGGFPTAAQGIAGDATLIAALNELPR